MSNSTAMFEIKLNENYLNNLNLESYKRLKNILDLYEVEFYKFAIAMENESEIELDLDGDMDDDEYTALSIKRENDIIGCYEDFIKEFKEKTGLRVNVMFSDEHDESFFALEFYDIFKETELAKNNGGVGKLYDFYTYNN